MDVGFGDRKLRSVCEHQATAAAARHPHPLRGDRAGQFALDLDGGRRLVFEPDQGSVPGKQDGSIDWSQVTRVRIVLIGDYHD